MPQSLEEEQNALYTAMGRALSTWSRVEDGVLKVFHRALVGAHFGPVSAAFYAVVNFNTKLEMTEAALSFRLAGHEMLDEWRAIALKLRELSKARVPLAHFQMVSFAQAKEGHRCFLSPSIYNANTWPAMKEKAPLVSLNGIKDSIAGYEAMRTTLAQYEARLREIPEPPPTSYALRDDKSLPQNLRSRLWRKRQKQRPPSQE